jgi:uncharacterized protein (TIGR02453 family)
MAFRGWPAQAVDFFVGLEADNSKAYWTAHKDVYERDVRQPMIDLLAELQAEFGEGKVFRPYRDVRFSADKSPYKTSIAATLSERGYISLSADALGVGSGLYMLAPDQLERYRRAVADDQAGSELAQMVAALAKKQISTACHDTLKTAPKGYPKDHPRVELLRMKGLVGFREWEVGEWLSSSNVKKNVVDALRAMRPLNAWLTEHVGDTEMAFGRRGG